MSNQKPMAVQNFNPFGGDPFFRHFFGDQGGQQQTERTKGVGSGVIISSDGYIPRTITW